MKIFIGFDAKETVAYHVCSHSIMMNSSSRVEINPLILQQLRNEGLFTRENSGTTEFSLTRFLVPFLSGYSGWSLFMDCDMVVNADINKIFELVKMDPGKAVYVCQHDYTPKTLIKATGTQTDYPRKNWSSFMLFNNEMCKELSLKYVNEASPAQLHRFEWLADEMIGSLPLTWNWLVGEYEKIEPTPEVLHYTLGSPCFKEYANCDYSENWFSEFKNAVIPITGKWCPPDCMN
jgi:hypothetical protein